MEKQYDFASLVLEFHNFKVNNPNNNISSQDYFDQKTNIVENDKVAIEEKKKQIDTIFETMYGIDNIAESAKKLSTIQGTEDNEGKFGELRRQKEDLSELIRRNEETINCSQMHLKKFLWLYHYNRIQRMPEELYKSLKSGNCDEVQEANKTIKSFILLYEKHPNELKINNLINNQKIIDAANQLILAFDVSAQFDMQGANKIQQMQQMQQTIKNSINATAFLMNYYYLKNLSDPELKEDPLDVFGMFLFRWKEIINDIKNSNNHTQDENPLFTSEFNNYLCTKFVLNCINPRNAQFSQKLIPDILHNGANIQELENELERGFSRIEKEFIESFYCVKNDYYSGSFFNNLQINIDQEEQYERYKDESFEAISFKTIAVITKLEEFIKNSVSNNDIDYKVKKDIQFVDIKEFKTKFVKDVSYILLYHFNKSKILPEKMLKIFLNLLFIIFQPYYDKADNEQTGNANSLGSIIVMCDICKIIPFICSAWSNLLIADIKRDIKKDILSTIDNEVTNAFQSNEDLYNYYQNFNEKLLDKRERSFHKESIIKNIKKSLVGIIIQECVDIQDSFPENNYPQEVRTSISGFNTFIQEFLNRCHDDQDTKEMATWAKQKIEEIQSSFH